MTDGAIAPVEAATAVPAAGRRWRRRRWRRIAATAGLGFALTILTAPYWLAWIGAFLVVSDPLQEADALVILAGDEDARLAYGAQLFDQGLADWYILTNMRIDTPDPRRTYASIVTRKALRLGVPEERILVVPDIVETTYEEAVALSAFVEQRELRSLIVVTSPYHTRRARWILNQVFDGSGVKIIVRPVEDHAYEAGDWWRSATGWRLTGLEYTKMLAHLFGCKHAGC